MYAIDTLEIEINNEMTNLLIYNNSVFFQTTAINKRAFEF